MNARTAKLIRSQCLTKTKRGVEVVDKKKARGMKAAWKSWPKEVRTKKRKEMMRRVENENNNL